MHGLGTQFGTHVVIQCFGMFGYEFTHVSINLYSECMSIELVKNILGYEIQRMCSKCRKPSVGRCDHYKVAQEQLSGAVKFVIGKLRVQI